MFSSIVLYFRVVKLTFLCCDDLLCMYRVVQGSWVARNAAPPINNMTVTCSHCEQKYVYLNSKGKKKSGTSRRARRDLQRQPSTE